jgi:hypothetical protein
MKHTLKEWQCFEIDSKDFARVRVCAGSLPKGTPHITGDIVETDAGTCTVTTSLGNYYELSGPSGLSAAAEMLWEKRAAEKRITGVIDVSDKVLGGIRVMDGGAWAGEQR